MSAADAGADAGAAGAGGGAGGAGGGPTDAAPAADGTWNCAPFSPTAQALFVFDRLLDPAPLGDGGASAAPATVTAAEASGPTPLASTTDYASNGAVGLFVAPNYNPRFNGPSLVVSPAAALPAGTAVTFALDGTVVRAKDGHTPFDGESFAKGSLTFLTAGLTATITPPAPPPLPADAGACATPPTDVALDAPATITFNSPVDPATIAPAVTATASPGGAVQIVLESADGLTVTVTPKDKWPASATVTLSVAGTATDLNGEMLGAAAPQPVQFTTEPQ
jgi:hypothetical protein